MNLSEFCADAIAVRVVEKDAETIRAAASAEKIIRFIRCTDCNVTPPNFTLWAGIIPLPHSGLDAQLRKA